MSFHDTARNRRLYRSKTNSNQELSRAGPARILVVDDQSVVREILAEYLSLDGYRVSQAADASQALALIHAGELFDLVLTDIDMPGDFDGLDLARVVKEATPATKVILISGGPRLFSDPRTADLFIRKPATGHQIRYQVARVLR
jgi:CheY-like chemotaxis protein